MPADPAPDRTGVRPGSILVVVLVYAVFATLWILLSDKAVEWLFSDPVKITLASSIKGGLFVAITSLLLYRLMQRSFAASAAVAPATPGLRHLGLPFALLAAAIFALAASGISYTFSQQRDKEVARLQAIADLRAHQITDWLTERLEDAEFVRGSQPLATDYRRWRETGDNASRDRLQALLAQWSQNRDFAAIMLLDAQGTRLLGSPLAPANIAPLLQDAARQTIADQRTRLAGPYRDQDGRLRLDFLALLAPAGVPPALVVLETDPNGWLYRTLQDWPTPSASGETLIFRRDGDQVLFLSELRHLRESAVKKRIPVATAGLLAAQVLRGETGTGRRIEGEDYRRVAVLGVAQAIPGTDWFLIAKMDRAELYGEASQQAIWIALSGMLALLTAGAGFYLLRQRQQFAIAIGLRQSQEARLRTLHLLTAITDSSDDAIFAKDLSGRYILFNRAASRFVGKPAEAVLGQDDHALFPTDQAEMLMAGDRQALSENRSLTREERLDTPTGERVFLATKGPLLNVDGMAIGSFGISRDITERNRAEQALRESEVTYRSLFENMMNGYAYCRMLFENGNPIDFIYLNVNRAFEQQTGLHDVTGRKVSEVIPGIHDSDPHLFEAYGRVALGGPPERFEIHVEALKMWFSISVYCPCREHFVVVFDVI
ncbi:MAG: PAS domain-containing protein, partial [Gallionellaceae bacterium]|nr:PAS domain-containing protein [Gallionellaceae bacterium]